MLTMLTVSLIGVTTFLQCRVRHAEVVYRSTPQAELRAHVFRPASRQPVLGAIVFLHGGGWYTGSRRHFVPIARALAKKGYVTFTVDYRVHGKHGTSIDDSLADARFALQWAAAQHARLGFRADRIALAGGSAGGHLAACLALHCEAEESVPEIRSLILLNPVLDITNATPALGFSSGELKLIADLSPERRRQLSPLHKFKELTINTLIAYGTADPLYQACMETLESSSARLVIYPDAGHGFFNKQPERDEIIQRIHEHLMPLNRQ